MIKGNNNEYPPYIYMLYRDDEMRHFILPNKKFTSLKSRENLEFDLEEEEYYEDKNVLETDGDHEMYEEIQEDGTNEEELPNFTLPEITFTPTNP